MIFLPFLLIDIVLLAELLNSLPFRIVNIAINVFKILTTIVNGWEIALVQEIEKVLLFFSFFQLFTLFRIL